MEYKIIGKDVELKPMSKEFIEKKMSRIDNYLVDKDVKVRVEVSRVNNVYNVEATIFLNGGRVLRAVSTDHTFQDAVLKVVDRLVDQIRRVHTLSKKRRSTAIDKKIDESFVVEDYEPYEEEDLDMNSPKIVRNKFFEAKPMSPEEAILQMELVGHTFFVFLNADTDEICVVYKRKDGQYGLIEPEFA